MWQLRSGRERRVHFEYGAVGFISHTACAAVLSGAKEVAVATFDQPGVRAAAVEAQSSVDPIDRYHAAKRVGGGQYARRRQLEHCAASLR